MGRGGTGERYRKKKKRKKKEEEGGEISCGDDLRMNVGRQTWEKI